MEKIIPKVSIVVPTYNRDFFLKECLNSIIAQKYSNLEIVVSDDNSTDNTFLIVKEFQTKFNFIKYVKNDKYPKGPNGNKNNGLDYITGDIVCIFDDDDIMLDGALKLMVKKILEGYDIVLANCIRSDNNRFAGIGFEYSREIDYKEYLCGKMQGEFLFLFKENILRDKRFDTDIYGGESTLWKGLFINRKIFYIHKAVRLYRIHPNSVIHNIFNNSYKVMLNYERDIEYYGEYTKENCPCYLAATYKNLSYFAKISGNLQKSFISIFKSIRLCPSYKNSYIMLIAIFLPKQIIPLLSKFRVWLKNR